MGVNGNGEGVEGGEEEEEEVCVVGSVEYYNDFCLDWRGVPVREVGGGVGGKGVEWKPSDDTSVLYPLLVVYSDPYLTVQETLLLYRRINLEQLTKCCSYV